MAKGKQKTSPSSLRKSERNREILRWRENGITLQAIANQFGLTVERIRQIVIFQRRVYAGTRPADDLAYRKPPPKKPDDWDDWESFDGEP